MGSVRNSADREPSTRIRRSGERSADHVHGRIAKRPAREQAVVDVSLDLPSRHFATLGLALFDGPPTQYQTYATTLGNGRANSGTTILQIV